MNIASTSSALRSTVRALALAGAALALCSGAQAQGGHRGGGHFAHGGVSAGHFHGGFHGGHRGFRGGGFPVWGGVGLGIGLGLGSYYYGAPWYVTSPDYVVVDSPPVVYGSPQPVPSADPQPVIYPRKGQSAAQIDADSDACSQWAGAQPNATVDPTVFRRAISACMDARGYTVR
jgi:hypothetical protein